MFRHHRPGFAPQNQAVYGKSPYTTFQATVIEFRPPAPTQRGNFMKLRMLAFGLLSIVVGITATGCVHAARDTTGFEQLHSIAVTANFDDTWQAVKSTLRDKELDIYTRDKRGTFVAYTPMKRRYLQPNRYQYTFSIEAVSENETKIALDTRKQSYGVTLLTYPGWHDRKTTDAPESQDLLDAIQAKLSDPISQ